MSILIVPDTHVIISGARFSTSYTGQIMQAWSLKKLEIACSEPTLRELHRVFTYPAVNRVVGWNTVQIEAFIAKLRKRALIVTPSISLQVSADPDDDKLFECAVAAGADYIVSKDKHLLEVEAYQGIQVVKPGYFVEQVLKETKAA